MTRPNGVEWPAEIPDYESSEFEAKLTGWLLGFLPAPALTNPVFRRHLDVLLHVVAGQLAGSLTGLRESYSTARAELGVGHPPETVAASLAAISGLGRQISADLIFIEWVREQRG